MSPNDAFDGKYSDIELALAFAGTTLIVIS